MSGNKLVYMANQIAGFFHAKPEDQAVAGAADHMIKFWDPRMRSAIIAHLGKGGAGLDPPVREAVSRLKAPKVA